MFKRESLTKDIMIEIYDDIDEMCLNCVSFVIRNYSIGCFKKGVFQKKHNMRPCNEFEVSYSSFERAVLSEFGTLDID